MQEFHLHFEAEVIDEQRPLNGRRYLVLAGRGSLHGREWTLALSFDQPKEPGAPIDEGELTLSGDAGELFAGLVTGSSLVSADDVSLIESEVLELDFALTGGEGVYEDAVGPVRVSGRLSGGEGVLRTEVVIQPRAELGSG